MGNALTFTATKGQYGLWYVTSPDVPGLLVTGDTMHNALLQVQETIDALAAASTDVGSGVSSTPPGRAYPLTK